MISSQSPEPRRWALFAALAAALISLFATLAWDLHLGAQPDGGSHLRPLVAYGLTALSSTLWLSLIAFVLRSVRLFKQRSCAAMRKLATTSVTIAGSVASDGDVRRVFQVIVDEARTFSDAQFCALASGATEDQPLDPWAVSGVPTREPPRLDPLLRLLIESRRPLRLDDISRHPLYGGPPEGKPPMGPFLGVPVLRGGRKLATLLMGRAPGEPVFTEAQERAAELFASLAAVAIENARLYAQALEGSRAREDLLASVSHDLKNPLSTIRMSTQLLRRGTPARAPTLVERIARSEQRMSRLISDLLDASKIEAGALKTAGQMEEVGLLLEEAAELFADRPVLIEPPDWRLEVPADRELLLHVFTNLVGNALKFSPEGSAVTLAARARDGEVEFSVGDHGPGMSPDEVAHAFDRYWQSRGTDRRGSGLGLYIVRGIVEAHGGRVWIDSTLGAGTTVRFTLPADGLLRSVAETRASRPASNASANAS
jgi:signal transduction histidine kinase